MGIRGIPPRPQLFTNHFFCLKARTRSYFLPALSLSPSCARERAREGGEEKNSFALPFWPAVGLITAGFCSEVATILPFGRSALEALVLPPPILNSLAGRDSPVVHRESPAF